MPDTPPITGDSGASDPYWKSRPQLDQERREEERKEVRNREKLEQAVRNAAPSIAANLQAIADREEQRRRIAREHPKRTDALPGGVTRRPEQPVFPPAEATAATTTVTGSIILNCAFRLVDATIVVAGEESNRVRVMDGKVNGAFPSGMGAGNYILDLATPEDALIYVEIDFDPLSLFTTAISLGVSTAADMPESRVEDETHGFLYEQIGFTYFDANGDFQVYQDRLGNINFAFSYGQISAIPALLPIGLSCGWLDLDGIFTP